MKLKLEKAYRHYYSRESYLDAYRLWVKVKKENPEWYEWERVCGDLTIKYHNDHNEYKWSIFSWSDGMDKILKEIVGDIGEFFKTRKEMMKVLERVVEKRTPTYYKNGKEIEYELA